MVVHRSFLFHYILPSSVQLVLPEVNNNLPRLIFLVTACYIASVVPQSSLQPATKPGPLQTRPTTRRRVVMTFASCRQSAGLSTAGTRISCSGKHVINQKGSQYIRLLLSCHIRGQRTRRGWPEYGDLFKKQI